MVRALIEAGADVGVAAPGKKRITAARRRCTSPLKTATRRWCGR